MQCHGSGAQGSPGFPNLNDDDWLWGGDADQIYQTISHGVRFAADADTRTSEMPGFGEILEPEKIAEVSAFVASLGGPVANAALIEPGAQVFAENCAACHGDDGKGNREFGAPDLTDALWLYGSGEAAIAAQVRGTQTWRHAGMGGAARRHQGQGTDGLCPYAGRWRVGGAGGSATPDTAAPAPRPGTRCRAFGRFAAAV